MTIIALNKLTEKLIKEGHGRKNVCVDKASFNHPLENDGAVILLVSKAEIKTFNMMDDEGGLKENKDGSESLRTALVIDGGESSFNH